MVLRKLKRLLGLDSSDDDGGRSERDVTVQSADTETEAAVKGVDDDGTADEEEADDEPVATDTDASASTESLVDEAEAQSDSEGRAEPAEAAAPDAQDESTDVEAVDAEDIDGIEEAEQEEEEPVAAGTDADASTESLVDEEIAQDEAAGRAEPAEAAGPGADDETTDVVDVEPDTGDDEGETEDGGEDEEPDSPAVDTIKGIGPAYSERLGEIGIETVAELADADAADVAERTTVPEKTVRKWIDRANGDA